MELTGKAKLVFEACAKITQGEDMIVKGHALISEGKIELVNLMGEAKTASPGEAKAPKHKSFFRKENRTDEQIGNAIVDLINKNGPATTSFLQSKIQIGDRRMANILGNLCIHNRLKDNKSGVGGGTRHSWVLPITINENVEQQTKKISVKTGRPIFDETKYVESALSFLKTHDWVTKGMLLKHLDISAKPGNRLFDYLERQRLAKQVAKRNNPNHRQRLSIYNQEFQYWEAVA